MIDDRAYWMWLSHACGQGSFTAVRLAGYFGDAKHVYKADENALRASGVKIDDKLMDKLLHKNIDAEIEILEWCDIMGVSVLCPGHLGYPENLTLLLDAPMVLYALGNIPDFKSIFSCAVVGTRSMSEYGAKCAYDFGYYLAKGGAAIISGIAKGIDTVAMTGALDAGGTVIAVLGNGIDVVYPKENEELLERIVEKGCIITEYPPGASPDKKHFPVRNRLISGLSQAVLVVEGSMRSGSLITARHAFYQSKDIYAVPGPIDDPNSLGTNMLIREGVQAVTYPEQILDNYQYIYPHIIDARGGGRDLRARIEMAELPTIENGKVKKKVNKKPFEENEKADREKKQARTAVAISLEDLGETELQVYRAMHPDLPMLPEEILPGRIPIASVMSALTILEVAGAVEAGAGGYFIRHADDEEVGEPSVNEFDEGY